MTKEIFDPFFYQKGNAVTYSDPCGHWSHTCVIEFIKFMYSRYNKISCSPGCKSCLNVYESFSRCTIGHLKEAFSSCLSPSCVKHVRNNLQNVLTSVVHGIRLNVVYLKEMDNGNDGSEEAFHFKINYDVSDSLKIKFGNGIISVYTRDGGILICIINELIICEWMESYYRKVDTICVSELPEYDSKRLRIFFCTCDNHSKAVYRHKAILEDRKDFPIDPYALYVTAIPRKMVLDVYLKGFLLVPYSSTVLLITSLIGTQETFEAINKINRSFLDRAFSDFLLLKRNRSSIQKIRTVFTEATRQIISFIHYVYAGQIERSSFYAFLQGKLDALSEKELLDTVVQSNRKKTYVSASDLLACAHALHSISYILGENLESKKEKSKRLCIRPTRNKFYELIYSVREIRRRKNQSGFFSIIGCESTTIQTLRIRQLYESCFSCRAVVRKGLKGICFRKRAVKRLVLIAACPLSVIKDNRKEHNNPNVFANKKVDIKMKNLHALVDVLNKVSSQKCFIPDIKEEHISQTKSGKAKDICSDIYCKSKFVKRFDDAGRPLAFEFTLLACNTNRVIFLYDTDFHCPTTVEFTIGKDPFVRKSWRLGKRATISLYNQSDKKIPVMINCRQSDISAFLIDKRLLSFYDDHSASSYMLKFEKCKDLSIVNSNFCTNLHGLENVYCLANDYLSKGNGFKSRKFPSVTKQLIVEKEQDSTHSMKSCLFLNTDKCSFCFNSTMFRSGVSLIVAPDKYMGQLLDTQITSILEICQVNPLVQHICVSNEKANGEGLSHMNSRFITTLAETISCLGNYSQKASLLCDRKAVNYFIFSESVICNAKRHCVNPCIGRFLHQSNDKIHPSYVHNDLPYIRYADDIKKIKRAEESEHVYIRKLKKRHNILSSKTTIVNRSKYSPYAMNCGMNYIDCHYGLVHRSQAKIAYAVYRRRIHDIINNTFPFQKDNLLALQLPCVQFLRKIWHLELKKEICLKHKEINKGTIT